MRYQRSTHSPRGGLPLCSICGTPVPPHFAFDIEPSVWAHPSCMSFTLGYGDIPPRTLLPGQKVVQKCLDANCVNPAHLEAR